MKINTRLLLLIILFSGFSFFLFKGRVFSLSKEVFESEKQKKLPNSLLYNKALALKSYAVQNEMDTTVCFLINMKQPSSENRFFVYDLIHLKLLDKGLVTHGRCNERFLIGRKYGNTIGCGCTSLGKYKIGKKYQGKFGLAYKLHGLDKGNSNAFKRFVVLHSHGCVPEAEVALPICQSDGCPTVAPEYLKRLSNIIDKNNRPVLMELFDE